MDRAMQIIDHYKASGRMKQDDMAYLIATIAEKSILQSINEKVLAKVETSKK